MKKLLAVMLVLALLGAATVWAEDTQVIELGTSGIMLTIPADYAAQELSAEDTDESQVAYYKSENALVDFDLYQWAKADGETLETVAGAEAAEFEATAEKAEFNGVAVWFYNAKEEYDGEEYETVTYLTENGDFFAEIVFWLDGENPMETVNAIMGTLAIQETAEISDGGNEIVLGTSHLKLTTAYPYEKGELTSEDTDENQVAYYQSEDSLVDFDVYQWARAEDETAENVANEEAKEYGAENVTEITVNDIVAYGYYAEEEYDGETYKTFTLIAEDGDDFVELVFWLDGEDAEQIMTDMVDTLVRF